MFDLPPLFVSDETLKELGREEGLMHEQGRGSDSDIPAAYTFFAQFVDHDITLDVTSQLNSATVQEVEALPNLRTMTLDLDCLYGFGPEASPHLFGAEETLLVGNSENPRDLARVTEFDEAGKVSRVGTALIGDPRNDENIFVSQLQYAFHLFHNKLIESVCGGFEEAQREARYHYQYIVLHDFLQRICDPEVYQFALKRIYSGEYPLFYGREGGELDMPVEFSVAAYRFGHSMVRNKYQPNQNVTSVELFDEMSNGFSVVPEKLTVEWRFLLDEGTKRKSRKIDELLAGELVNLPVVNDPVALNRSLPFRNLVRGRSLGLPSGQDVAAELAGGGYPIDPKIDLKLSDVKHWNKLPAAVRKELKESQPLFFYLLRESNVHNGGKCLGPTGSAILMEVFGGVLAHCEDSFLRADWSPRAEIAGADEKLCLADILKYVDVY
ncbi:MAG: peroxidase family protein [Verrucomicrobiota bacterium]